MANKRIWVGKCDMKKAGPGATNCLVAQALRRHFPDATCTWTDDPIAVFGVRVRIGDTPYWIGPHGVRLVSKFDHQELGGFKGTKLTLRPKPTDEKYL